MPKSQTASSTRRLSDVARHVVIPEGIVATAWPRVVAKCRELGVEFDDWQHGIGSAALGKRADGTYAASVGGIVLSIPRQVGKTFLVGMIVIALCLLFPGLTVLWTAHRTRTATKTFHTLKGMTERPKVKPFMLDPRLSNGEQEVRFRNGSVIMFGAREQGFGRGFDEVDVEVFDEAQILSERALEDMVPATNQSRQPSGALLFFMGTPPRPGDPGDEFKNRRTAALAGTSEDMLFIEFSADADADLDDHEQWRRANPSFPLRTPVASMKRMRRNLTDDDSFRREALGIWDAEASDDRITPETWRAIEDANAKPGNPLVVAIDAAPNLRSASIVACGLGEDGRPVLEVVAHQRGVRWVEDVLPRVVARSKPTAVGVLPGSPAGSLIDELERLGVVLTFVDGGDFMRACGAFVKDVNEQAIVHRGDEAMTSAVYSAARRNIGDAWKWSRRDSNSDISPLVAGTLARHLFLADPPPLNDEQLLASFY